MKTIIHTLAILLACIAFSCRTVEYVSRETIKHDTTYINKLQRDSTYERDSIFIRSQGDTVLIEKFKYKYVDKLVRDTTYVSKTDSVRVPYPVERKLTRWESLKMSVGGYSIGIIIIIILIVVGWLVYKLKK